jgi:hypothetical protein
MTEEKARDIVAIAVGRRIAMCEADKIVNGELVCGMENQPNQKDRMTEEKARKIWSQFKSALYSFGGVHPNAKAYFLSEGYIQALEDEREKSKGLVEAVEKLQAEMKALQEHQHKLLIEGQTFKSACENWVAATSHSIYLNQVFDALARYRTK